MEDTGMTKKEQILQSLYDRVIEPSEALEQLEKAQEADKELAEIREKVKLKTCANCNQPSFYCPNFSIINCSKWEPKTE
jgi:hypothetical protein